MKKLTVSLAYSSTYPPSAGGSLGYALPVKALDPEGSVLAEGAAGVGHPLPLELPATADLVFVRLTWPSGRSETQRVGFKDSLEQTVTFSDTHLSANEWSAWAIPKLNPKTRLARSAGAPDLNLDRFARVWLRLWKFSSGNWVEQRLSPTGVYRNASAWQLDLSLEALPYLLQIGGSQVRWRFVSLPGGGPARVLITPKDSSDPRADELKIIVTSFRADAETLLEFLVRDARQAADTLAKSTVVAQKLFAEKFTDPLSATAGAYYLLRYDAWQEQIPLAWFENLSLLFSWLPDTAIIHCVRLLRGGLETDAAKKLACSLLIQSLKRGWPVYAEGIALLQEASALLSKELAPEDTPLVECVRALGGAKAWGGAATSFYGRDPKTPSALQWFGMPDSPQTHRLDPDRKLPSPRGKSVGGLGLIAQFAFGLFTPGVGAAGTGITAFAPTARNGAGVFLLGSIKEGG